MAFGYTLAFSCSPYKVKRFVGMELFTAEWNAIICKNTKSLIFWLLIICAVEWVATIRTDWRFQLRTNWDSFVSVVLEGCQIRRIELWNCLAKVVSPPLVGIWKVVHQHSYRSVNSRSMRPGIDLSASIHQIDVPTLSKRWHNGILFVLLPRLQK